MERNSVSVQQSGANLQVKAITLSLKATCAHIHTLSPTCCTRTHDRWLCLAMCWGRREQAMGSGQRGRIGGRIATTVSQHRCQNLIRHATRMEQTANGRPSNTPRLIYRPPDEGWHSPEPVQRQHTVKCAMGCNATTSDKRRHHTCTQTLSYSDAGGVASPATHRCQAACSGWLWHHCWEGCPQGLHHLRA
jgi:hypothetical protein